MIRFLRLSLFVVTLTFLFISCDQDPTSVGSNLISEQDKFTFQQLNSDESNLLQKSSYFEYTPKLGGSQYLLLGKTPYSESSIMLHYEIYRPDTTLTRISNNEVIIKEAWMEMIPRYAIGDNSSAFDFTVHQVRTDWTETGFDRDSMNSNYLKYDPSDVKYGLVETDTTVKFSLNPEVIKEWLMYQLDKSKPKNDGIILKPGNTSKMLGFSAIQTYAIVYETNLHLIFEYPDYYKDTLIVAPDRDVHAVTRASGFSPPVSSDFYVEAGYSLHGSLFFDVSALPKTSIINRAILELTVDDSKELDGDLKSDSIYVQLLADSTLHELSDDSLIVTLMVRKDNIFSGDISWAIQKWLDGHDNQGLSLTFTDELSSAARIAFYGSKNSNTALRPKLKITYLQKK